MNFDSSRLAVKADPDPPHLHLAAIAFSYPLIAGSLTFSEATSALARAAIRDGVLSRRMPMPYFVALRERLDLTLSRTILEIEADAAEAVRRMVRMCIERRADRLIIEEAARSVNERRGHALPQRCVSFIVAREIAAANG